MAKRELVEQDLQDRTKRAEEWRSFRKNNLITQKKLSDILGISRRTIQQIEAGIITPHNSTLRIFAAYAAKYKAENAA